MTWNVFRCNTCNYEIEVWNVFNHTRFRNYVERSLKLYKTNKINYQELDAQVRTEAQYYFWSKSEHEVVITSWPPYVDKEEIKKLVSELKEDSTRFHYNIDLTVSEKIDIYDQLSLNWDAFITYIVNFGEQPAKELELDR